MVDMTGSVWDARPGEDTMNKKAYGLAIAGFTVVGLVIAAFSTQLSYSWRIETWQQTLLYIVGFLVFSFIGLALMVKSDKPFVSFSGSTISAIATGILLGPVIARYTDASVARVFILSIMIVLVIGIVGALIPEDLEGWGRWLSYALIGLIVGGLGLPFLSLFGFNVDTAMTVWDYIGVGVFCLIVIFDLNRAMHKPKNLDNAIDCAGALVLDIANIFIRLLSIMGQRNSR